MTNTKDKEFLRIVESDPVSLEEWKQIGDEWVLDNPEACRVIEMAHNMAQFFEEENGYTRRMVCEGLFLAALELSFRHQDQKYIERPEDQRDFHLWALKRLKIEMDVTTTPQEQTVYEEKHGKRPLWLFDSENFGAKDDEKTRH